jgi:hypothetical protein
MVIEMVTKRAASVRIARIPCLGGWTVVRSPERGRGSDRTQQQLPDGPVWDRRNVEHGKVAVVAASFSCVPAMGAPRPSRIVGRLGERAMRTALLVFVLVGYVVALVPARLCHLDIGSFRRALWVGYGSRDRWLRTIKLSYIVFGWPSLLVALAWRRSTTRRALVELRDELREVQREPERTGAQG